MSKVVLFCIAVVIAAAPGFPLFGQNASGGGTRTVEEVYLERDMQLRALEQSVRGSDPSVKLSAIRDVQKMLAEGSVSGDDEAAFSIVKYLAYEGNMIIVRRQDGTLTNFPMIRMEACRALGQMGGDRAKMVLTNVLMNDKEPLVLAEAVFQISEIGIEEEPEILQAIARKMIVQDAVAADDNFTVASLHAIERIAQKNGGIKDPEVFRAVLHISERVYPRVVREKALDVLNRLRRFEN